MLDGRTQACPAVCAFGIQASGSPSQRTLFGGGDSRNAHSLSIERRSAHAADRDTHRGLVGLLTGGGQSGLGTCSRPADNGIRRFISLGDLVVRRTIGSVPFETQAFVGLFALRTRKQRIRHWVPPGARLNSVPRDFASGGGDGSRNFRPKGVAKKRGRSVVDTTVAR